MRISRLAIVPALALALLSCGRSVTVQPLTISSEHSRQACAELAVALPKRISAGRAWKVQPDPQSTAAWGSPPVVLRCGDDVPQPAPTDQLVEVDGLSWLVTALTEGEQYSTVGRSPGVLIAVPSDYAPTASVIAELSPVIAAGTSPVG